jgi:hypothetical protein
MLTCTVMSIRRLVLAPMPIKIPMKEQRNRISRIIKPPSEVAVPNPL